MPWHTPLTTWFRYPGYASDADYLQAKQWFVKLEPLPDVDYSPVKEEAEQQLNEVSEILESLDAKCDSLLRFVTLVIGAVVAVGKMIELQPGYLMSGGLLLLILCAVLLVCTRSPARRPLMSSPKAMHITLNEIHQDDEGGAAGDRGAFAAYLAGNMHQVIEGTLVLSRWKARNTIAASVLLILGLTGLVFSLFFPW